jgi:N-acetyltransferase
MRHEGSRTMLENAVLSARHVRLEPLTREHIDGLVRAASADASLYRFSPVPLTREQTQRYVDTALAWRDAGTAVPFATVRASDGVILGSTRFWNIEFWPWPHGHARHEHSSPDACEIGYTWLTSTATRTAANTEAKLLMLEHAFETWRVARVCFHTDARNHRSAQALERIGAKFEGVLRSHRLGADLSNRDSMRYSILATEWPDTKQRLRRLLDR